MLWIGYNLNAQRIPHLCAALGQQLPHNMLFEHCLQDLMNGQRPASIQGRVHSMLVVCQASALVIAGIPVKELPCAMLVTPSTVHVLAQKQSQLHEPQTTSQDAATAAK